MKKTFILFATIGSVSLLSADYYNPQYQQGRSCPGGNCGAYYQNSNGYYNQPYQNVPQNAPQYYQGNPQGYQGQPQYIPQGQPQYIPQGQPQYAPQGQPQFNSQSNQPYNSQVVPARPSMSSQSDSSFSTTKTEAIITDGDIAKKVHDLISSDWFSKGYKDVLFDVNDGAVTLKGSVETIEDKRKVEEGVKKIPGVKQVNNQITVRAEKVAYNYYNPLAANESATSVQKNEKAYPQDYASTENDRHINADIRNKLNGSWFSNGFEAIIIKTSNGAVLITGTVEKPEDIQKISDTVKKVEGVKTLNNQLKTKNK